jgi:hypothetical protein
MSGSTETSNEDFVILVDVIETTIPGNEGGNLLSVLNQLNTDALTDSRVGLLGLNTNLFQDNSLGHGGSSHRVSLHSCDGMSLAVFLITPALHSSVSAELATSANTIWLTHIDKLIKLGVEETQQSKV